jgi:multidrug resistance protein, MATE family
MRSPAVTGILAISLPIMFAKIGEVVVHVTDTSLLARVGTVELGAIALADEALEIWMAPTTGLAIALQIALARRWGERQATAVGHTFRRGFLTAGAVALLLALALWWAAPTLAEVLVGPGPLATAVTRFLRVAAWGLPLEALGLAYEGLLVATGCTRVLVRATALLAVVNLAAGWVLIFGNLGAPRLEIVGAGWAFVLAQGASFAYLTGHVLRRYGRRWALFQPAHDPVPVVRPLARLAAPVTLQFVVESACWLGFFAVVAQAAGTTALAITNVVYSVYAMLLIPTESFGQTVIGRVSVLIGCGRADQIGVLVWTATRLAGLVTWPVLALVALWPRPVLAVFGSVLAGDPNAIDALRVVALALLVVIPAELWLAALDGTGDTSAAFGINIAANVLVLAAAYAAVSVLGLRLPFAWLGVPLAGVVALGVAWVWMRSGWWRRVQV